MNTRKKLRLFFRSLINKFGTLTLNSGMIIYWDGEEDLKVGDEVFIEGENAEEIEYLPVPMGEYQYGDKTIIVDENSRVSEIREVETEEELKSEETEVETELAETEEEKKEEESKEEAEEEAKEEAKPEENLAEEVENPTNEGEETDTEAIVELRKEVNELYARVDTLEEIIKKLNAEPAAPAMDKQFAMATAEVSDIAKRRLNHLRKN